MTFFGERSNVIENDAKIDIKYDYIPAVLTSHFFRGLFLRLMKQALITLNLKMNLLYIVLQLRTVSVEFLGSTFRTLS